MKATILRSLKFFGISCTYGSFYVISLWSGGNVFFQRCVIGRPIYTDNIRQAWRFNSEASAQEAIKRLHLDLRDATVKKVKKNS